MLKDINIKAVYNSEDDNILKDFYIPALSNAISYDRAVGYFDAKMLIDASAGLSSFVENKGHMRLIVGATLTEDEYRAISNGYDTRECLDAQEKLFEEIVESEDSDLFKYHLNTLSWLVRNSRLDVKIALRRHGIHHQKIGIFRDTVEDFIVFQGSANETTMGLLPFNYETINVFKGWRSELNEHFEPHIRSFNRLWENKVNNTMVLDFSEITERVLNKRNPDVFRPSLSHEIGLWQKHLNTLETNRRVPPQKPRVPAQINRKEFNLRDHQRTALTRWKENNFHGVFELATGSGKTITAIYGAVKMFESRKRLFLVVAVPYQNLADQWEEELALFNITPTVCYGGEAKWLSKLAEDVRYFTTGVIDFAAAIVVDATMTSKSGSFIKQVSKLDGHLSNYFLFIGDECHHHGAEHTSLRLPTNANLRIGLSATPDRGEEDLGNDRINEYYGDIIYKYTLKDALTDKVLTPYEYHVIPVMLTAEETDGYISLSKEIGKVVAIIKNSKSASSYQDKLNVLLSKRARIVNGSVNKRIELENLLQDLTPIEHSLFYCAEGKLEGDNALDDDLGIKQIEVISQLLHKYGWKSSRFTANENKKQRGKILSSFKDRKIHSLVAMKCLDEGVDIPLCSTAFILASSRKPRQFVQRRGRILRKAPGKEKAVIYDFFVTLMLEGDGNIGIGRKLLIAELKRINEFASLALNKTTTYRALEPYLKQYDLFHHIV